MIIIPAKRNYRMTTTPKVTSGNVSFVRLLFKLQICTLLTITHFFRTLSKSVAFSKTPSREERAANSQFPQPSSILINPLIPDESPIVYSVLDSRVYDHHICLKSSIQSLVNFVFRINPCIREVVQENYAKCENICKVGHLKV